MRDLLGAMSKGARCATLGLIALGLAFACGRAVDAPQAGSNSNWLKTCGATSECGGEFECLCGKCTRECWSSTQCPGAECQVRPGECDAHVSVTSICGAVGAELRLEDVPREEDDDPFEAAPTAAPSATQGTPGPTESGGDCTLIGCRDVLGVELIGPNEEWVLGSYVIELGIDDERFQCTFDNVGDYVDADVGGVAPPVTCSGMLEGRAQVFNRDCFPCVYEDRIRSVTLALPRTPDMREVSVSVAVARDGVPIFDAAQPLRYENFYPNGERCGGPCQRAVLELTLPELSLPE